MCSALHGRVPMAARPVRVLIGRSFVARDTSFVVPVEVANEDARRFDLELVLACLMSSGPE